MNLLRHRPRMLASDPFSDLDSWTDQFFNAMRTGENHFHLPATDIHETDAGYEVTAELPGIKKEDIRISLDNGVLSIEAQTSHESEQKEKGQVLRRERRTGKYMRRFALGPDIDEQKVEASFKDGVLHLVVPRQAPQAPESRKIEIQ